MKRRLRTLPKWSLLQWRRRRNPHPLQNQSQKLKHQLSQWKWRLPLAVIPKRSRLLWLGKQRLRLMVLPVLQARVRMLRLNLRIARWQRQRWWQGGRLTLAIWDLAVVWNPRVSWSLQFLISKLWWWGWCWGLVVVIEFIAIKLKYLNRFWDRKSPKNRSTIEWFMTFGNLTYIDQSCLPWWPRFTKGNSESWCKCKAMLLGEWGIPGSVWTSMRVSFTK